MPSPPEQQNDTTSAASSPTLALPDQPATPSAPARAATQIISTAPGRFGEELGIAIARHVSRGEGGAAETLSLRLDPPEHGRIEVTLSFEDGGPLRAVVAASQPATLDLLRRDSADLSRALGQAGIGTDAQSFSFSAQSQSSGRERQGQAFPPQPTPMHNRAMAPEEIPLPAPDYRPLRTSGRLNLIA
jgi:flagellar hook-length control protein FliK